MTTTKLLLVDDNPANLAILEEIFSEEHECRTATSGDEALEALRGYRPDVVLLDIMMPGIDGYEVCRRIRQSQELETVKVIMVSAKAMLQERLQAYELGADDYITKPFDAQEILSKVKVFARLKRIEEVDKLKRDVFTLLVHGIQTPLKCVIGPAEFLCTEHMMDQDQRRRMGQAILANVTRLRSMFAKLQMLGELRAGRRRLERHRIPLVRLLDGIVRAAGVAADERGVRIVQRCPDDLAVIGDPGLLAVAIGHVVDNAVRYSPTGGKVEVEAASEDGTLWLTITDHGKGIPPEALPRVFSELVDADSKLYTDGPGLSLAITAEVVRRHGGEVSALSEPDARTVFTLKLPLTPALDAEATRDGAPVASTRAADEPVRA